MSDWLRGVKFIRVQIGRGTVEMYPDECHTIVEFVNGGRACSCGLIRGEVPSLR